MRRSGTSVWVCEPQAVSTAATYFGLRLSLMSKIFMPSQEDFSVAGCVALLQELSLREESVERKSRSPETEMSFCEPGQSTWLTVLGAFGSADVEDPEAVVVAGEGVLALEGQVRVGALERVLGDVGQMA